METKQHVTKKPMDQSESRLRLFATPQTIPSTEFSRPEYWSVQPFPSPGNFPNPGIEPRSSTLQVDSLPAEPQGKPKNTGVGSLSLLQRIFPTQELNQGLLHCSQILYQLSYEGMRKSKRKQKVNKTDKLLATLTQKGQRTQANKLRNKKEVSTDTPEIQNTVREYYERLYANKFNSPEKRDKFLETYSPPKFNQEETDNLDNHYK